MIKIQREDCPDCLDTASKTLAANDHAQNEVVEKLLDMQHFKCCYCEKDLSELGKTANWVEHFIAKTDDSFKNTDGTTNWNLANAWENLLYACSTCNARKSNITPFTAEGKRNLVDPSYKRIDPEKHIDFKIDGPIIVYRAHLNSKLGKNTIKNLKLKTRYDIYAKLRKRKLIIDRIFTDVVNLLIDGNTSMATSKLNDLRKITSGNQPHASFSRKYVVQKVNNFNQFDLSRLNQHYNTQITPITVNIAKGYEVIN